VPVLSPEHDYEKRHSTYRNHRRRRLGDGCSEKAMEPSRVAEQSHDLAAVIDPVGLGTKATTSPWDIDSSEAAARIQEAMR
jgi:hypothetical protein